MKHFLKFSIAISICCGLNSCKPIIPPDPQIVVGTYSPPVQDVSLISVPVDMELKPYFKAADESVPYQFKGKEEQCDGVSFSYTFERKPIGISGHGKSVDIEIDGKYALNLNYCAACTDLFTAKPICSAPRIYASCGVGEPMRKIKIEFKTDIDLKSNFQLQSTTQLVKINPKDRCEITVFHYDATDQLVKEVKNALKDLGKEIDQSIEDLEIRKQAEDIWNSFSKPFPIQNYGFLYLHPEKIAVNDLSITGSKLNFTVVLEAFPIVNLQKTGEQAKKLPNQSKLQGTEGFNINLDLIAPYDSLSAIVNRELSGKTIEIKRQKIIIQHAEIHGASNQKLTIEVDFTGSKSGKMFLIGTPKFNDSLQEISFPDLTFELQTKNTLLKSAKWLFNDKITDMIRKNAQFNISSLLLDAAKNIEYQMNQKLEDGIYLKGKLKEVKVKTIFPDTDKLIIQSNLSGTLNVSIK